MASVPSVSVVMPVHNAEKYLRQALDSLRAQSLTDFECICVDDGSTDSSPDILDAYAREDPRFRILHQGNLYAGVARNNGLREARGDYVIFLDADDFFAENLLELTVRRARETDADIVIFGGKRYHDARGDITDMPCPGKRYLPAKETFSWKDVPDHLFQLSGPEPWTKLCRRTFLLEKGLAFLPLEHGGDVEFTCASMALAQRIAVVGEGLVYHRTGKATPPASDRDANPTLFLHSFDQLHAILAENGIFDDLSRSFVNALLNSTLDNLNMVHGDAARMKILDALLHADFMGGGALDQPLACYENRNAALWAKGAPYILAWYRKTHAPASDHGLRIVKDNRRDEKPSVSVIIPVYNGEPWLSDCLASILNQTLRSIEIICIDDGSTDQTLTLLKKLADEDERLTIAAQANAGQSCARNAALALARGDFVYFMDADDILDTDALRQLYERATQDRLDILFFDATSFADCDDENCLRMAENGKRGYQRHFTYPGVYSGPDLFRCLKENTEFLPSPCLQLVHRAHLTDHSLAFADGIVHEDELFTFASILLAGRAGHMARSLYRRRYRMDSTMTRPTSFANVYGYFRCFLGMQDVLGTIRLDERQQEAATNRLGGMLYQARNRYLELSPEEQYAVEGLPTPERKLMKLYVADWGRLKTDTRRLTKNLRTAESQKQELKMRLRTAEGPKRFCTARLDIRNQGQDNADVTLTEISDPEASLTMPAWFNREGENHGYVLESSCGRLHVKIGCVGAGTLHVLLRGKDFRDAQGQRIPARITCHQALLDGEPLFPVPRLLWHDRPFRFERNVEDGQTFTLDLSWMPEGVPEQWTESACEGNPVGTMFLQTLAESRHARQKAASLEKASLAHQKETLAREKANLARQLADIRSGWSFRTGRAITWLPRKVRSGMRCCREHGLAFTVRRFLEKCRGK